LGYDGENAYKEHEPMVFDLETVPLANVRQYVDPPDLRGIKAPKNYKSADAIASYVEDEAKQRMADYEADLIGKAALDINTARIACFGWQIMDGHSDVCVYAPGHEDTEALLLQDFWKLAISRPLIGFRIREFDLPMLIQRSRYLGVRPLDLDLGRYARREVIRDLHDVLTFNDMRATSVMRRGLKSFARRFGIPVDDETDGADVPALIAAGNLEAVCAHCTSDVRLTVALAQRIGVLRQPVAVL
jgi:hypothetical protein